jgi:cysteine sulfinate desulfinase/cysteine desulfurase-like protein
VLRALGLPPERVREGFRIGLGRGTSEADVDRAADVIADAVQALRAERAASPRPARAASLTASERSGD